VQQVPVEYPFTIHLHGFFAVFLFPSFGLLRTVWKTPFVLSLTSLALDCVHSSILLVVTPSGVPARCCGAHSDQCGRLCSSFGSNALG